MIKPNDHVNEIERLKELDSYDIMDSPPELDFDNLTKLASDICNTPISLVSLIDNKRQWFKSRKGLDVSETPKELAFCAHAINISEEILVVKDSRKDERFYDNPLVTDNPNVIFYVGVPLITENGLPLGTLCVIDHEPRELTSVQKKMLVALANQVMKLLELRKKNFLLEKSLIQLEKKHKAEQIIRKSLKQSHEELQEFTYIATHDLKVPINNIKGYHTALMKGIDPHDKRSQDIMHWIEKSIDQANDVIKNLVTLAQEGNTTSTEELLDIREVYKSVAGNLSKKINLLKAEITVDFESHSILFFSKRYLTSIFQNLLSNALEYHSPKRAPKILISTKKEGKFVCIKFVDNGTGIDLKTQRENLFGLFKRIQNNTEGSGMGLYMIKKLVEKLGGKIEVESELGLGSTFYVYLKTNNEKIKPNIIN